MDKDGFEIVKKGKRRNQIQRKEPLETEEAKDFDLEEYIRKVKGNIEEIGTSDFFVNLVGLFRPGEDFKRVVCLGIGRFCSSVEARYQLCLLDSIIRTLKIPRETVSIFEPHIGHHELRLAKSLGYVNTSGSEEDNKEGKYPVAGKTLFFLPHCPKQLTNNLLWSNWNPDSLANLVLICNSFERTVSSQPDRILKVEAHAILRASTIVEETSIDNIFRFKDVFNDLSFHRFPKREVPSEFWEIDEPSYEGQNLEFVRRR